MFTTTLGHVENPKLHNGEVIVLSQEGNIDIMMEKCITKSQFFHTKGLQG